MGGVRARLDVEQHEVGGVEQAVVGATAQEPRGVQGRVQAGVLGGLQQLARERRLLQRLAA
jgi:hypothetical protein